MSGRILALDVGQRRIGLALSDPSHTIASPLGFLTRSNTETDAEELRRLMTEHGVEQIIVGLPLRLSGERGVQAILTERWVASVEQLLQLSMQRVDERLTTIEAHRSLEALGLSERQRRTRVDAAAAALLLQTYLDGRASQKRRSSLDNNGHPHSFDKED
ncbi:MAG: Holliday junction resolvase RuvX [Chloroflexi bacterium]|nr:Holliday junction resolvase RuvX [Chloroflexota bacterium]